MKSWNGVSAVLAVLYLSFVLTPAPAAAGPAQDQILKHYQDLAGADVTFSADRGKEFFMAKHTGGKPKSPSCTSCHTKSPLKSGRTHANKKIAPMALSKTKDRYSELKKVKKWFRRNCRSVLGRECSPQEKGDFLVYMMGQ